VIHQVRFLIPEARQATNKSAAAPIISTQTVKTAFVSKLMLLRSAFRHLTNDILQIYTRRSGMKMFKTFFIIFLLAIPALVFTATQAYADDVQKSEPISYYYTGFSHPDYYFADTDGSMTPFSWMPTYNLRTAHKILGYTALASGLTTIGSGIKMTRDFQNNHEPSSRVKSIHRISAAATAGFTITAFTTGVLSYGSMLDFGDGMNTQTTHALLGTLATIGFVVSAAMTPGGDGILSRNQYVKHCSTAEASGALMLTAVIVIQF
jgi:hypothetical protein